LLLSSFNRKCYKCHHSKSFEQLPNDSISDLDPNIIAFYSGPDEGIFDISMHHTEEKFSKNEDNQKNREDSSKQCNYGKISKN
jgi:hypothetical protein